VTDKDKYMCGRCGYIYDPEFGDEINGSAPGTPFEALPEDWTCPMGTRLCICQTAAKAPRPSTRCGALKDQFSKMD
jgi:rubredoxin